MAQMLIVDIFYFDSLLWYDIIGDPEINTSSFLTNCAGYQTCFNFESWSSSFQGRQEVGSKYPPRPFTVQEMAKSGVC